MLRNESVWQDEAKWDGRTGLDGMSGMEENAAKWVGSVRTGRAKKYTKKLYFLLKNSYISVIRKVKYSRDTRKGQ